MLLTFFYMIATSVQAWRITSLKARLHAIYKKTNQAIPSIMLYTKPPVCQNEETLVENTDQEAGQNLLSSHLCLNKNVAKLGDLLWCDGDTRLCIIYPQQKVDISEWLLYHYGESFFPLYAYNCYETSCYEDRKMHILIEADLECHTGLTSAMATKLEDYGLIITWSANKNLSLILESNLDHITKLVISVMEGQFYINNGLFLTRIESVILTGKPCIYDKEHFDLLPDKLLEDPEHWLTYVQKLRTVSNTAKLVSQQNIPLEMEEIPGVVIFPKHKAFVVYDDSPGDKSCIIDSPGLLTPSQTPASANTTMTESAFILPQNTSDSDTLTDIVSQDASNYHTTLQSPESEAEKYENSDSKHEQATDSKAKKISFVESSAPESFATTKSTMPFSMSTKPPNVLIYAKSDATLNTVKAMVENALTRDRYTIYSLTLEEAQSDVWIHHAAVVIVCGEVDSQVSTQLVEYITHGGKLFSLCSNILPALLPCFKHAQLCQQELIKFSYAKWKHVCTMHHVFCYESVTQTSQSGHEKKAAIIDPPRTGNIKDKSGKLHSFDIKILGTEDKCRAPSILSVNLQSGGGKVVFCQIHLELDPIQYESDDKKYKALKQSNTHRLEIFNDLLAVHLEMEVDTTLNVPVQYSPGFFLGRHELKLEMLDQLKDNMQANDTLKMDRLSIKFCSKNVDVQLASSSFLPVMIHQCPDNFSTIEYFENLKSTEIGRLVIYADILTSTMDVVRGSQLRHGLAVISRQQTHGQGRNRNKWLSPKGCAMFTLQLHISSNSRLGSCISILQHIVAVATVSAVKCIPGYENIDLKVKWPNDMYAENTIKLGGILVNTQIKASLIICNIGVGINLLNSVPTSCINDIIVKYNKKHGTQLPILSIERYTALIFSELERLLDTVQGGNLTEFLNTYYKYWMHNDAEVTVVLPEGKTEDKVKVMGIDTYGFLKVQGKQGNQFTVHPDGNTFDVLKGLIAPK